MESARSRRRIARIAAAVAVLALGAGVVIAVLPDEDDPSVGPAAAHVLVAGASAPSGACGAQSATTVAAVDRFVAGRIYMDELQGTETRLDSARVRSYAPLLAALAANRQGAVRSAVHALVYMPHWHIVRLRVVRAGGTLADVGGPYIIAPVSGSLRLGGRTLGRYVLSVQDDVGYLKLVSRFIGVPIELYRSGRPLMGTLSAPPPLPADGADVTSAGRRYRAVRLSARAFPAGELQVALFVPTGGAGGPAAGCRAVRVAAWGSIATHLAARFHPLQSHYRDLADMLLALTGGRLFVRSGSQPLQGAAHPRLPRSGGVRYAGRNWAVFSWEPAAGQRAYLLTPPG